MNALLQESFWKMSDRLLICLFVFLYTNLHKKGYNSIAATISHQKAWLLSGSLRCFVAVFCLAGFILVSFGCYWALKLDLGSFMCARRAFYRSFICSLPLIFVCIFLPFMRVSDIWVILNPSSPAWADLNFQFLSEWLSYFDVHQHLLRCWLKIQVLGLIL